MLQPLKAKRVVCPAVLRDRELLIVDVDASFVDDERQGRISSSADALYNCNPLPIAWLNKLRSSASLSACDNLY
ncbi:uncharacterized protein M421DRAFT_416711 [Didymella exigua CBS 183.55]|uniref:Uncharacterized protein n=1 Tax=Didymella exigua CBS 183.55 TaxID=1150837 RepID=A0A6A5RZT5_9PLEO|nr:uncharacterized protein M421DRAFT_416711 [Didymella exigua CBS 183.55]KAF1933123.1 hypothetical protein M421DRAFT_416711 [Didymella exigua CBS 183.55]